MNTDRVYNFPPLPRELRPGGDPVAQEVARHLAMALTSHVRRLHRDGYPVPRELHSLANLLSQLASTRQDPPEAARGGERRHYERVPDRLLVTKAEAAERLGVSVRTVERLAATGRLPQVHIERSARFRVKDLESYVDSLTESVECERDESGDQDLAPSTRPPPVGPVA
jgi:excisionase family DNA binding protein